VTQTEIILSFLVAVLLGFLIGLERERKREVSGSIFAGIRTFPLIALFGAIIGHLAELTSYWIIAAALLSFGSLLLLAYWRSSSGVKIGGTTEVTALVSFGLGILAGLGQSVPALAGAVIATAILSLKDELRLLSDAVSRADLFALVQFSAVSLVILPIIPNENMGPWDVWNPRSIWLLVVLISGISFIGYVLSKLMSTDKSIGLSGFIGGIASSTAVTLSFSERSKTNQALSLTFASGILSATAISMIRLLVLIGIINTNLLIQVAPLFLIYSLINMFLGWIIHRSSKRAAGEGAKLNNPFKLRPALTFAALFALVLLITKAAQVFLGEQGIFIASFLSGFTQLDAIVLTLTQQSTTGLATETLIKSFALALTANSIFKSILSFTIGSNVLARVVTLSMIVSAITVLVMAWFLPIFTIPTMP